MWCESDFSLELKKRWTVTHTENEAKMTSTAEKKDEINY